jgi:hypothetical protein
MTHKDKKWYIDRPKINRLLLTAEPMSPPPSPRFFLGPNSLVEIKRMK